jgi:hypothetical protein
MRDRASFHIFQQRAEIDGIRTKASAKIEFEWD